jgi:predicted SAM-dependent methyltransferase
MKWFFAKYYELKTRFFDSYHLRFKNKSSTLSNLLEEEGKTRWLDMGSSSSFTKNFYFADLYPKEEAKPELKDRYYQFNATEEISEELLKEMGTFDLIRMQHVYEHFTPEQTDIVLANCHKLLNQGGYLLVTVPDLKIFVDRYRRNCLDVSWSFTDWAETRIEKGSPQSDYFSIFTHSVLYQSHHWCYDEAGLINSINKKGLFQDVKRMSLFDKLAEIPFTHNRAWEDLCVIATKK